MANALEGRHPVVPMPQWANIVGCTRAVVAILVLAFSSAATGIWGGAPGFGFALFTSSATLIVFAYYFVALSRNAALYNRWAVLALETVGTFLWLVTIALLSGWTAHHHGGPPSGYGFWNAPFGPSAVGLQAHPTGAPGGKRHTGIVFAEVATALSGVEFALFAVFLVTFGLALHKQREGETPRVGPTAAATAPAAPIAAGTNAEGEKNATVVQAKPEPMVV